MKEELFHAFNSAFPQFYNSLLVNHDAIKPYSDFNAEQMEFVNSVLVPLRKKPNWRSHTPYGAKTETSGILGEVTSWKHAGLSTSEAKQLFLTGLKRGDCGWDYKLGRFLIDVKASQNQDKIFQLSDRAVSDEKSKVSQADVFLFASINYDQARYVRVVLEDWAWKADVKPWLRKHSNRWKVRLWVLKREGVLLPMSQLLDLRQEG